MTMKKILFAILLCAATLLSAKAESFIYMNFTSSDQTVKQVFANGMTITFADGKAIVTSTTGTDTLSLAELSMMEFTNTPESGVVYAVGDVNGDGLVDVTDVNILIDIVLGKDQADNYERRAYVSDDELIDVTDVNMIIDIVLGK